MGQGLRLQTYWLESVDSTQKYLLNALRSTELLPPVCIAAKRQHSGMGSRGNSWISVPGNLFFSIAVARERLPFDLKLESASIYFMYQMQRVLKERGSKVWLKWPNDLYLEELKVGGCITTLAGDAVVCGIGVNLASAPEGFGVVDVDCGPDELLEAYQEKLLQYILWKQVFIKYQLEFEFYRGHKAYTKDNKILFADAVMMEDGSLMSQGGRIYSQR